MTKAERAKEYLSKDLTEDQMAKDLTKIYSYFLYELKTVKILQKFINEIQSYMEIQKIDNKIDFWYIKDLDHIYDITNYVIIIIFSICGKELNFKINLHT